MPVEVYLKQEVITKEISVQTVQEPSNEIEHKLTRESLVTSKLYHELSTANRLDSQDTSLPQLNRIDNVVSLEELHQSLPIEIYEVPV